MPSTVLGTEHTSVRTKQTLTTESALQRLDGDGDEKLWVSTSEELHFELCSAVYILYASEKLLSIFALVSSSVN